MAGHTDVHSSKLTYEDYVTLPDDGPRYEILDGDLAVSPSPSVRHQYVSMQLSLALGSWIEARGLGVLLAAPCDVILDDTTVVVPDLSFVSRSRSSIVTERAIEGAPDLVVEILSDSTAQRDRGSKMKLYTRYGVERYWLVDVDAQRLEMHALRDGAYPLAGVRYGNENVACDVPAGLTLRLGEIWPT